MDDVTKALERLEQKWRAMNESVPGNEFSQGIGQALAMCADELATLRQSLAEPEEVEPVAWLWLHNGELINALLRKPSNDDLEYGSHKGYTTQPLYTTPRAAEAIDEAMVERALAALTPPSAKGEL